MIMPVNIHITSLSRKRNTAKNHLNLKRLIGISSHHLYMEDLPSPVVISLYSFVFMNHFFKSSIGLFSYNKMDQVKAVKSVW